MTTPRLTRRKVLRGMGAAVALPWLDSMAPVNCTSAAEPKKGLPPLRMLFFNVPNGAHMPAWTPKDEGPGYELTEILKPITAHRESISVLSGLALDGAAAHGDGPGDHARSSASFLTGAHPFKTDGADIKNSVSVDQVAAQAIGSKTRFPSLELGLEGSAQSGSCDSKYSCAYSSNLSWRNASSPLAKEIDPAAVFDRLFTGENVADAARNKSMRSEQRKSILDFVQEDAKGLQRKLGASDQRKLDEYLYAVRDIENRLVHADKLRVGEDGIPNYPRPAGVPRQWSEHCKLMMDMTTLAIQSDSTRILSFMYANEGNNRGFPEIGAPEGHHDLSHHGKSEEKQAKVQKINIFHMQHFAHLLDQLAAIKEGERSLLDNCLIVYGSGISDGDRHNHDNLPILLCGRGAGRIKRGTHIKYPDKTPLCNLYLWMLRQMGVQADSFGDSTGVLNKLA